MGRYDLSEIEWRVIEPLLPNRYGPYTTGITDGRKPVFDCASSKHWQRPRRIATPLRQTRQKLPGRRPHRINRIVAQSL